MPSTVPCTSTGSPSSAPLLTGWGQAREDKRSAASARGSGCAQELALTGLSLEWRKGALMMSGAVLWDDTSKDGHGGL